MIKKWTQFNESVECVNDSIDKEILMSLDDERNSIDEGDIVLATYFHAGYDTYRFKVEKFEDEYSDPGGYLYGFDDSENQTYYDIDMAHHVVKEETYDDFTNGGLLEHRYIATGVTNLSNSEININALNSLDDEKGSVEEGEMIIAIFGEGKKQRVYKFQLQKFYNPYKEEGKWIHGYLYDNRTYYDIDDAQKVIKFDTYNDFTNGGLLTEGAARRKPIKSTTQILYNGDDIIQDCFTQMEEAFDHTLTNLHRKYKTIDGFEGQSDFPADIEKLSKEMYKQISINMNLESIIDTVTCESFDLHLLKEISDETNYLETGNDVIAVTNEYHGLKIYRGILERSQRDNGCPFYIVLPRILIENNAFAIHIGGNNSEALYVVKVETYLDYGGKFY
jgi:hypothetical protein